MSAKPDIAVASGPLRAISFGDPDVSVDRRDDGTIYRYTPGSVPIVMPVAAASLSATGAVIAGLVERSGVKPVASVNRRVRVRSLTSQLLAISPSGSESVNRASM